MLTIQAAEYPLAPREAQNPRTEAIGDLLPEYEEIRVRTEADYYGAANVVAQLLGRSSAPRSFAYWQHGWVDPAVIVHPREVAFFGGPHDRRLVANERIASFLRSRGYTNVVAAGLPLIYLPPPKVERLPSSLLVMPAHSLPYTRHTWSQEEYGEQIQALRQHFSTIVVCVHNSCVENDYWVRPFEKAGIAWIRGAKVSDRNSLLRMRRLFARFETMTTNALGSHVPYAAFSGCRVSIYGAYAASRAEDFTQDPFYAENPELLDNAVATSQEAHVRTRHPGLFRNPAEAVDAQDWANQELGVPHRRNARELRTLLGWSIGGQLRGYAGAILRRGRKILRT